MDLEKKTKLTYVLFEYKNGAVQDTITELNEEGIVVLITGTTRDQRFVSIKSVVGTYDIFNLDNVINVTVADYDEHSEDDEDE